MADLDIVTLILSEHEAFRRDFEALESLTDTAELAQAWRSLADRLEVHASAEEVIFYPALLRKVDEAEEDTEHAIKDHNKIRSAAHSVDPHEVGTDEWWTAVHDARDENNEHLDEEEKDVLPPFREEVDSATRDELGTKWIGFHEQHENAKGLSGKEKDSEAYVEKHTP